MNIPRLWSSITRNCYQAITKMGKNDNYLRQIMRNMHFICSNRSLAIEPRIVSSIASQPKSELLKVKTPMLTINCGFKVKVKPKLRCKDCYYVVRQERLYVFCKSKPRHKQMGRKADDKKSWMLSHATQGKERAW